VDRQIDPKTVRRRTLLKWLRPIGATAAVIAAVAIGIRALDRGVAVADLRLRPVATGSIDISVPASGKVVPMNEQLILSPVESRIIRAYVHAGDTVSAGQPLLELDLASARAAYDKQLNDLLIRQETLKQQRLNGNTALSELRMNIAVKEMDLQRLTEDAANERRLDSIGSGTGERVRQAETARRTAELQLEQLREQYRNEGLRAEAALRVEELGLESARRDLELLGRTLAEGQVPAPYAGIVTYINSVTGTRVGQGERIAVVADLTSFRIDAEIPESSGRNLSAGTAVDLRLPGGKLAGAVSNINPQSTNGILTFTVRPSDPSDSRLSSGRRVDIDVNAGYIDSCLTIASGPFFKGPGEYSLFVADSPDADALHRRKVRLGRSSRTTVEVLSGLEPGEHVATADLEQFESKSKLKIRH